MERGAGVRLQSDHGDEMQGVIAEDQEAIVYHFATIKRFSDTYNKQIYVAGPGRCMPSFRVGKNDPRTGADKETSRERNKVTR
jgi:hypothetical protein